MKVNRKDLATGLIFVAFGALYGETTRRTLPLGEALNMGPGYFPMILCIFLIVIGVIIALRSLVVEQETPFGVVPWRGIIMLSLSTILFAAFLRQLGMFPAIFLTTLVACLATRGASARTALLTSSAVAVFCVVVFDYGLDLSVPIFGSWFGG